jgi:hypothetical protein
MEFIGRHPGLLLVLIGVVGEIVCDWKEIGVGRLARAKKISAILLIVGLMMEFWEAAKSDNELAATKERTALIESQVAGLNKEAADARVVAGNAESNSVVLAKVVLQQAQQIQDTAKTAKDTRDFVSEPTTTARLAAANNAVSEASKVATDVGNLVTNANLGKLSQLLPKPLKDRLIDCLNSIDPKIINNLPNFSRTRPLHVSGEVESIKYSELEKISQEQGAQDFIIVHNDGGLNFKGDGSTTRNVTLDVNPDLLKK